MGINFKDKPPLYCFYSTKYMKVHHQPDPLHKNIQGTLLLWMGVKVQLDVPRLAYRIKQNFMCVYQRAHTHSGTVAWHHVSLSKTKISTIGEPTAHNTYCVWKMRECAFHRTNAHSLVGLWIYIGIHSNGRQFYFATSAGSPLDL